MKATSSQYQTLIFCLFIISGNIKFIFTYYEFPVDITLLFAIFITLDIVYNLLTSYEYLKITANQLIWLALFLIFYSLFFFSLLYTESDEYSYKKTFYFLLSLLAFIYPIFIKKLNLKLFARIIIFTAVPASVWFIMVKHLYWSGYKDVIGLEFEPLLGAYLSLSMCIAFLIFFYTEKNNLKAVLGLIPLLLALGSRGSLLFVIIIIILFKSKVLLRRIINPKFKRKLSLTNLALIAIIFPVLFNFRNKIIEGFKFGLLRFESFLHFQQDNSSNERLEYFEFTINGIFESTNSMFCGHGIGSFGILFSGEESRHIPHNIFLEAWFELGILATICLAFIMVIPLTLPYKNLIIKMMAVFFLLEGMKSGGFDEMRFTFGIYGILCFIDAKKIKS